MNKIEANKTKTLSEPERRKKLTEVKRLKKKEYLARKKAVLENEEENFRSLYVVEDQNGWYKMFGHSALIYANEIAARLKIKPALKPDTDYDFPSKDGVVSVKDLDGMKENLRGIKIHARYEEHGITIFELGYKITQEEINEYRGKEELEWKKINQIVCPKVVMPEFKVELKELARMVHENVRKMDETERTALGTEMDKMMQATLGDFVLVANGWYGKDGEKKYFKEVEETLNFLQSRMLPLTELRVLDRDKNYRLAVQLERVRNRFNLEVKKYEHDRKK